jgi:hypothetical protein
MRTGNWRKAVLLVSNVRREEPRLSLATGLIAARDTHRKVCLAIGAEWSAVCMYVCMYVRMYVCACVCM